MDINCLQNWLPLKLTGDTMETVEWFDAQNKQFTEPFFEDTISVIRRNGRKKFHSVSCKSMLKEWATELNAVNPSAIIFHVSRCGSTLLSQQLATDERNIVLSEVPFIDQVLRNPLTGINYSTVECIQNLKAAVRFYGQKRFPQQQRLFIKTDSWHIHFYQIFREAFPRTPFILLYRNPAEVLQSQQKKRGLHAIPGIIEQNLFGFTEDLELNFDQHLANVLASYFRQMIHIRRTDPFVHIYNYSNGITTLTKQVYELCCQNLPADLEQQFVMRSMYHAKDARQPFEESYNNTIPDLLQPVLNLYNELDALQ